MDALISKINELQDVCSRVKVPMELDLPQIVVVGIQSSGKSSLMESIVMRGFIPRGDNLVTRRPLEIRLTRSNDPEAWAEFSHTDKKFTNFDEVRDEIEKETDRICGPDKGIREEPIVLKIHSENVVDLTLVDLPGLVRIPTGSQPKDIDIQTRELAHKFIANPKSIILAVTAANVDIVTSEAIKLVREVDPDGKRTLVVVTKFDTVSPSAAEKTLDEINKTIPKCLGVIAVVNRSTDGPKKSVEEAIKDEADFLRSKFTKIAEKHGQSYLSKRLSHLLKHHIRDSLPGLKNEIDHLISEAKEKLDSLGEPVEDKQEKVINILNKFALSYGTTLKTGHTPDKRNVLLGGARIAYIYRKSFAEAISTINPLGELNDEAILFTARNLAGSRKWICIPTTIEFLVKSEVKRLESPSLQSVSLVYNEMEKFDKLCSEDVKIDLMRFPNLRKQIQEVLTRLLNTQLPVTQKAVLDQISYATADFDIDTELSIVPSLPVGDNLKQELYACELIAQKARTLFNEIRDEIRSIFPKIIKHCMINNVSDNLHTHLFRELYHSDKFDSLLMESEVTVRRREDARARLNALKEAREIINSIQI